MSDHSLPNGDTEFVITESVMYDLFASIAASAYSRGINGYDFPETRDELVAEIRQGFPPYLLHGAIAFTMAGRPEDRKMQFMQNDVDAALAAGDLEIAIEMQEGLNEQKARLANDQD